MTSDGSIYSVYNLRAFFTRITFVSLRTISTHFNCCSLLIYWISGVFRNGYVDLSFSKIILFRIIKNNFFVIYHLNKVAIRIVATRKISYLIDIRSG